MKESPFFEQANLLLDIIPLLAKEPRWALKGGTAINFFIRDLPRLSVDIDLAWLPLEDWNTTLKNIHKALQKLKIQIHEEYPDTKISVSYDRQEHFVRRLIVQRTGATIKVEPNFIFRGSVFPPERRLLSLRAQELFEKSMEAQVLSFADLYGSKICAALDRQHPRDLFDVKLLLENEGLTENVRQAFLIYLISHNRPMAELLRPNFKDLKQTFQKEFAGMTMVSVTPEELLQILEILINKIHNTLTLDEKKFILSIKQGKPEWALFPLKHIQHLPSVKWKLQNIERMNRVKHEAALKKLVKVLNLSSPNE